MGSNRGDGLDPSARTLMAKMYARTLDELLAGGLEPARRELLAARLHGLGGEFREAFNTHPARRRAQQRPEKVRQPSLGELLREVLSERIDG